MAWIEPDARRQSLADAKPSQDTTQPVATSAADSALADASFLRSLAAGGGIEVLLDESEPDVGEDPWQEYILEGIELPLPGFATVA